MSAQRYNNPELIDLLAREYVLGSLQGPARMRFERIHAASLTARRSVLAWERRLAPLASTEHREAPPEAWKNIANRIGLAAPARGGGMWRGLAAVFALAAIVLGTMLYTNQTPQVATANYVAVVTDAETGPVWLLRAFIEPAELLSNTINPRPEPPNSSYELWMLPDNGTAPVSLGLIAGTGQTTVQLSADALAVLAGTSTLAVSVEPAGGSPTGAPTGPVIYTAPLVRS